MKKKFKALIIVGSILAGITVLSVATVGTAALGAGGFYLGLAISRSTRKNTDPEHVEPPKEGNKLVFAQHRSLYDKDGNLLRLKGVNAGNVLVSEGWISPYSCGPAYNDDGSIKMDRDGNVEYPELSEEEVYAGLNSNKNLSDEQRQELIDVYRYNWMSADDFTRIKEEFHMNAIRLPFYWRNILNEAEDGTLSRKSEDEAFGYLDWFMQQCLDNDIYCILDLHGATKSQNGYEHSGAISRDMLWRDESAIEATCDVWRYVAEHYKDSRLGEAIATYDLLNEPCGEYQDKTTDICYPVFDRLYKAIRETGDNHVITIEGCWDYSKFINPKKYGWENIQYEIHLYNWDWLGFTQEQFYNFIEATRIGHDFDVPYFVGEFTLFDESYDFWDKWLGYYDQLGYSWTLWTYKKTVVGWWNDNWGLYNYRLYLDNKTHQQKVDLRTAKYEDLKPVFECSNTTNCYKSIAGNNVAKYLANH